MTVIAIVGGDEILNCALSKNRLSSRVLAFEENRSVGFLFQRYEISSPTQGQIVAIPDREETVILTTQRHFTTLNLNPLPFLFGSPEICAQV